ncbi:dna mismatch repair protein [Ophiostoma piceae UAMH 11346]|uniref:Dna mismatch repair protein n=1 Tax=Ophiostoma piceae (strain UAMH 11346) TaxID=1262450 RepID=S3C760_OPHP1|nr:dna mismatch repair protein [Ophiostoma piceae UAMH 11346]
MAEASEEESILILVDQHAADERCRVEALLQDYFSASAAPETVNANTAVLAKPLKFELPAHELSALRRARGYFRHWGIHYDILASGRKDDAALLRVDRLPVSIVDRCAQGPRLVMDILRSEVSDRGANLSVGSVPAASEALSWITRLNRCPQPILDLVSSKACRSAIRFNDPLAREECVELLARLLGCSFPFQCAHGRPSMVPVLNLS